MHKPLFFYVLWIELSSTQIAVQSSLVYQDTGEKNKKHE